MGRPISPAAPGGPTRSEARPSDQDDQTSSGGSTWLTLSLTSRPPQEGLASNPSIIQDKPSNWQKDFPTMTRLILIGILLLLSLAFILQNQEQEVTLRYFFGLLQASTPIYKPVMAGFLVGLLVAAILLFPP